MVIGPPSETRHLLQIPFLSWRINYHFRYLLLICFYFSCGHAVCHFVLKLVIKFQVKSGIVPRDILCYSNTIFQWAISSVVNRIQVVVQRIKSSTCANKLSKGTILKRWLVKQAYALTKNIVLPTCHEVKTKMLAHFFNVYLHIYAN